MSTVVMVSGLLIQYCLRTDYHNVNRRIAGCQIPNWESRKDLPCARIIGTIMLCNVESAVVPCQAFFVRQHMISCVECKDSALYYHHRVASFEKFSA